MYRRGDGEVEVALGEQRDRLTGRRTTRLPKGKPRRGESVEETALREVREETGLAVRVVARLGSVDYAYREADVRVAKSVHFFLMECEDGAARGVAPSASLAPSLSTAAKLFPLSACTASSPACSARRRRAAST